MAMCNIPSTCTDANYRYKMPCLVTKIEGRGNGIKTNVCNMGDVARAVHQPPQYTLKWFGFELGAQTTYTNKEGEGERAIITGAHDTKTFQELMDKFLDRYVLCRNCHLPEIDSTVKKGSIMAKCKACGEAYEVDPLHKLSSFIAKNPPDGHGGINTGAEDKGGKLDKKARQAARLAKQQGKADGDEDGEDSGKDEAEGKKKAKKKKDDDDSGSDEEKEKKKKKKKEKKEKKKKDKDGDSDSDDDGKKEKKHKKDKKEKKKKDKGEEDSDDEGKKEKKEKKHKKEKKEKKEKKDKDSDKGDASDESGSEASGDKAGKRGTDENLAWDDDETNEIVGNMRSYVESKDGKPSVADFFEEIRMQQLAKVFDHKLRLYIALGALFGDKMSGAGVTKSKKLVEKFIANASMPVEDTLWAFHLYIHINKECVKGFPMVLKALYDADMVKDKELLKYYEDGDSDEGPGFEVAKKAAAPFLRWLETPESDSGSGSGSEEDSD